MHNGKNLRRKKDQFYTPTFDLKNRLPEYGKAIKIGDEIKKMFWGNNILSQALNINRNLDSAINNLKHEEYISYSI